MSFAVEFVFKSGEHFPVTFWQKHTNMLSGSDDFDPFSKGPEVISSTVCEIYWEEGENVVKTVKQQKYEGHGSVVSTSRNMTSYSFYFFIYFLTYLSFPDPPEGRELDSAADFKSGNVVHHLVMPKSVSFDTKGESEHQYGNADEEKEDGNEKPEEGPKLDMVSAEGSSGEYSWKA
nr:nucleosome assembly protein 1-like 1 [Globicephala melas]